MFYRQVIYCHGLPFRPYVPENGSRALSEMTKEEFDSRMAAGLADAKAGRGVSVDEAFDQLLEGLKAAGKGAIHWRQAARKVSRLAKAVNAVKADA